jgi:hypothetical protein
VRGIVRLVASALLHACFVREAAAQGAGTDKRPAIGMNRWQEDWSVLADPELRTEDLDSLKYLPLSDHDPFRFLSLGLTMRERFELNDANGFTGPEDSYLLQRLQMHADVHVDRYLHAFIQVEDVRAFDKAKLSPVDENPLDVRVAFVEYNRPIKSTRFKVRVGRQDFAFDLQRFVSLRDGPNVRQAFDAAWVDWETVAWRVLGFVSLPVQYRDERVFDDLPSTHAQLHMVRVERHVLGANELSAYYVRYANDTPRFIDATGVETRDVLDVRFAGKHAGLAWDVEAMGQVGTVGLASVRAWAAGSRGSYDVTSRTALGVQLDAASGDRHRGDGVLGTFNPLYPNGNYFTLAGDTGYANLVHVKPFAVLAPTPGLSLLVGAGLQWRATTADAVYVQPAVPVANTAGQPDAWTGWYAQLRADYRFSANITGAVETVHYEAGNVIRRAGGGNSDYIGIEGKLAW